MPQTPQELYQLACIRFRRDTSILPWEFARQKKTVEIAVTGPLIVNDIDLMVKATRDGVGIGYMIEAYMAKDIAKGS